jgi:hypothetical protein
LIIFRKKWEIEKLFGCATRRGRVALRANGMDGGPSGGRFGEKSVEIAEIFLKFPEQSGIERRRSTVDGEGELRFFLFELGFKDLAGAGNGVALVVEKALDAKSHLDVAATVEALAGAAFVGLELRELALPEAQDVGRNVAEFGDFADAEVELVRDVRPGGLVGFSDWLVLRHAWNSEVDRPASDPA